MYGCVLFIKYTFETYFHNGFEKYVMQVSKMSKNRTVSVNNLATMQLLFICETKIGSGI